MPQEGRTRQGRPRKRAAILRAAVETFVREGYERASVEDIAARADVAKRTVYNHLGDKESLFVAACEDAFARINAETLVALETFPDQTVDVSSELATFGRALAGCYLNPEAAALRTLIDAEARRHPTLVVAWRERGPAHVAELLAERLRRLSEHGVLCIRDPARAAYHFLALATFEVQSRAATSNLDDDEVDQAVRAGVETFLRAYRRSQEGSVR